MMLGFALSSLATVVLFFTRNIPEVLLCRILSGFGIALFNLARHAYLADSVSIPNRGRIIALLGGVFRLGSFAGPAVGGVVAATFGLRLPFLLYGADILGLDVDVIGYIVSIAAAIDVTLFLPAGWIMDRLGRKVAIVPAFAIMAVGMGESCH
ncbi:MAG: hypothetical protein A2Z14_08470 [Chloroflexi bacterium RBG_16_48_8]|nr:MAG: hypothetical protein A2Z14_08470 [Chloroflexi bacterium RBG_16_48_8]